MTCYFYFVFYFTFVPRFSMAVPVLFLTQAYKHICIAASSARSLQVGESGSLFRQVSGYVLAIVAASITVMQKFIIPFITAYKLLAVQHKQTAR